jgi:serine protease Do
VKHAWSIGSLAAVAAIGLTLGISSIGRANSANAALASPPAPVAAEVQRPQATGTFAKLAEAVKPAVINVTIETKAVAGGRTPFEDYFGEEFFRRRFGSPPEQMPRRSLGSGFIIDPSGVALTNAHVVERGGQVEVVMLDGTRYKAKVVGLDKKTDLAVLRLENVKGDLPFLRLGNSDETQVGDWVIAVGSPFGLQATVTSGIVSAKARQIGAGPYDDFLQTDAAINPGNSGGPLVNMRGEVVGINTAIVRGGSGIGFAIPVNLARRISSELLAKGTVTRGWLGVSLQPLTPELAKSFGSREHGALIGDVTPDSPAARAGLQPGDIVLQFNGKNVDDPGDLARAVGLATPGQDAKLTIWRDKAEKTVQVKFGEAPAERQAAAPAQRRAARLGLDVRPLTPELSRELDLRSTEGVVVADVEAGSAAAKAGVQRNDVIREINRQPVKTVADVERLTATATPDQPLVIRVQRGGTSLFVAIPVERG